MPLLLYILFGAVLFGGGGALLYMMPPGGGERPAMSDKLASADPQKEPDAARDKAVDQPTASGGENRPAAGAGAPVSPSFDIVRIEKGGDGVIAGRAEPGWTVIVESNGREVARTTADQFGEWTVVLDKPLPSGEHSIGLRALSGGAALGRASEQHVSVSIAGERSGQQTVVALSRPGEPTKVLTPKEPAKPAPEAQTAVRETETEAKPEPAGSKSAVEAVRPQEQKPAPVAKPEERKPTQMASRQEEAPKPAPAAPVAEVAVSFSAVDYEVAGDGSGQLFLSGDAAAGARVHLYLNNRRIGDAVTGPDGSWTFRSASTLAPKTAHTMRADAVQADGQVMSRAEVEFTPPAIPEPETQVAAKSEPAAPEPEKPQTAETEKPVQSAPPAKPAKSEPMPEKPETAAAPEEKKAPRPSAQPEPKAEETVASVRQPVAETAEEKPPAPLASQPAQQPAPAAAEPAPPSVASVKEEPQTQADAGDRAVLTQKRSIVVRRGDTLWHIAERRYGSGIRYTAIYRDNRDQIRNPHWIYPGQEFSLPPN